MVGAAASAPANAPEAPVNGGSSINHGKAGKHMGIDVSHYDPVTNYQEVVDKLRASGEGADPFCFQKISEGAGGIDRTAARNIPNFQKAGCLTGVYHFMRVSAGVNTQVNLILNNRHGSKYVMLDAELDERNAGPTALAIIKALQSHGIKPILYSGASLVSKWGARKWGVPLWIARYSSTAPAFGDIWQYTEKGRIAGVSSNVDLNRLMCTPQRFEEIFY